jgi:tRNA(Ile)-lysidine synthase
VIYPEFKKFVLEHNIIDSGETIVVGVSGGVDSMVLLDMFVRLSKSIKFKTIVAHVNYGLRDRASDSDQSLVEKTCANIGVVCEVLKKTPPAGKNIQNEARKIRRDFFEKTAGSFAAQTIATAHHLNDQAETFILHLIRGAGIEGLSGILPVSHLDGIKYIRPLLEISKANIEEYAHARKIKYNEDSTNRQRKYLRNSARMDIIPMLARYNPKIVETLAKTAKRLSRDFGAIEVISRECLNEAVLEKKSSQIILSKRVYTQFPIGIRMHMVQMAFCELTGSKKNLSSDHLSKIDQIATFQAGKGFYRLPASCRFERNGDSLRIARCKTSHDR